MPSRLFGTTLASLRFAVLPLVLVVVSFMFLQSEVFAAGGTLANGAVVAGSITGGQIDQWTFTAAVGDSIWVSASEVGSNTPFLPRVDVIAPDQTTDVAATYGDLFARVTFRAQQTGTYTVRVSRQDVNPGGGNYELTLAQAPETFIAPAGDTGGPIANGGEVSGSILRGDMDMWSFQSAIGDGIWVSASEVGTNTAFLPRIDVYGPDGVDEAATYADLFAKVTFRAPQTGTYTIVVQRQDANDGVSNYELTLAQAPETFIVPAGDNGGTIANGVTVSGSISRGDLEQWSFGATDGNQIVVTATETGPNTAFLPRIDVYGPDGVDDAATYADLVARVSFRAPLKGRYTIVVHRQDANDGVGTYSLIVVGAVPGPVENLTAPVRLIDTRTLGGGPIAAGTSRCFGVAGVSGIPGDAGAVVLNVTAVGYGTNGWLTVYPNGQSVPATSTLNFDVHEYAIANGAIMRLGTGGQICVSVGTVGSLPGSAHVILDATGYLTAAGLLALPMLTVPQRVIDTRTSGGAIATGTSRCFTVAGVAGIPSDAAAIVVNLTAVSYPVRGWLTAYPNGQSVPATSTLNFDTSEYAIANGSIVRVGSGGQVCVNVGTVNSLAGDSDTILDVTGYLTAAGLVQMPMLTAPQRLVDTRVSGGPVSTGQSRCFNVAGLVGVPTTATAVVLNVTAVGYGTQGWLTAYPSGVSVPATSTLNFDVTEYAIANGAIIPLGTGGQLCVNVGTIGSAPGNSNIILDVVGYE
jgi:hypothetical protein